MKLSNGNKGHALVRYEDARSIDTLTIQQGNGETLLMGLAATGALHHLKQEYLTRFWNSEGLQLIIVCGSGNNGGDGLALASLLCADPDRHPGVDIRERLRVYALAPKSAASQFYEAKLRRQGVPIRPLQTLQDDAEELTGTDGLTIIEALLGTGQSRLSAGDIAAALQAIGKIRDAHRAKLVALDVPAGLTESGGLAENAPMPDCVYTFGSEKAATALIPGLQVRRIACGFEAKIEEAVFAASTPLYRSQPSDALHFFRRSDADHKYSAGHAWMVAGEHDMEGAALLALRSFFASGGGYIRHFHPSTHSRERYLSTLPSVIYHDATDFAKACEIEKPPRSILIGPGMGSDTIASLREGLIEGLTMLSRRQQKLTVILDAAACSLAFDERFPQVQCLITPHVAEWKSLGGPTVECVDDLEPARAFSRRIYTYLKGPVSFLFASDRIAVYNAPQPSLAVAGSGDLFGGLLLRAACGHEADRSIYDIVSACVALQRRSAESSMHPEQQLKALQEIVA
jgi:NAD(P)H-hydrate epimerase